VIRHLPCTFAAMHSRRSIFRRVPGVSDDPNLNLVSENGMTPRRKRTVVSAGPDPPTMSFGVNRSAKLFRVTLGRVPVDNQLVLGAKAL